MLAHEALIILNAENGNTTITNESPVFQGRYPINPNSTELQMTY
jgi:hypothetical protein